MFHSIPLTRPHTPLLDRAATPEQLRRLPETALPALARELREYLLWCTGQSGGHFGAGLGVVELTLALHYVYNTPEDRLVWDVGHQTYAHKVLTGRRDGMSKLRMHGGIAGFPRRDESEFDAFGTAHRAHASTTIIAQFFPNHKCFGMLLAREIESLNRVLKNKSWKFSRE